MKILQESRLIISFAGLSDDNVVQFAGWTIPRIVVRIIIAMACILCAVITIFICNRISVFAVILLPFAVFVTHLTLTLIYSTFIWKAKKIALLMDYLEFMVNKSNHDNIFETLNSTSKS